MLIKIQLESENVENLYEEYRKAKRELLSALMGEDVSAKEMQPD